MALDAFQAQVVGSLNDMDKNNQDLLDQVIKAASEASANSTQNDITADGNVETKNEAACIRWGGKEASIQGTGGVALLEYAKDAIQTAVSNISGVGTNQMQAKKLVERKMTA